jgi:hypothetical protein
MTSTDHADFKLIFSFKGLNINGDAKKIFTLICLILSNLRILFKKRL